MKGATIILLAALAVASPLSTETVHDGAAPVLSSMGAETIPGHYIIKFKKNVAESSVADHHSWIQQIHGEVEDRRMELRKRGIDVGVDAFSGLKHTYKIADGFLGYAGHFDDDVIEKVRRHPDVSHPKTSRAALASFACNHAF
jgi:cerevisin